MSTVSMHRNQFVNEVRDDRCLSPEAKLLALVINSRFNAVNGNTNVGDSQLQADTGLCEIGFSAAMRELEMAGYIVEEFDYERNRQLTLNTPRLNMARQSNMSDEDLY